MAIAATVLSQPDRAYQRGVLLVLLAGTCWSVMGLVVRYMDSATTAQILVYRSISLSPFLFILISVRSGGRPFRAIHDAGLPAIYGGMALVVAFAGGIAAIQLTTVANALFLFASAPFFAAILGWVMLGEGVRPVTWVAMLIGSAGIGLMVSEGISLGYMMGNLLAVASALGFALFTVALRWRQTSDMLPAVFLGSVFSFGAATAFCMTSGIGLALSQHDVMLCLALGVFQLGFGLTFYTMGAKAVPAAELALLSMLEVILGVLWVWLFLNEAAGTSTMIGGAVLLGAIAGNAISGARRKPQKVAV